MSFEKYKEAVVIGCGISGLATARWLKVMFFDDFLVKFELVFFF